MKKPNQKASLKISQDVIETIARVAALEIDGVVDTIQPEHDFKNMFSSASVKKPVDIKINDGIAEISICLQLTFGAKIGDVCEAVQKNVKENVQTMTGIMVSKVNIIVAGIQFAETNTEKSETADAK